MQLSHGDAQEPRDPHSGRQEMHGHRERGRTGKKASQETWNDLMTTLRHISHKDTQCSSCLLCMSESMLANANSFFVHFFCPLSPWFSSVDPVSERRGETRDDEAVQLGAAAGSVRGPSGRHGEAPVLPRLRFLLQGGESLARLCPLITLSQTFALLHYRDCASTLQHFPSRACLWLLACLRCWRQMLYLSLFALYCNILLS